MATISVIIITKNEEEDIRRCLETVKWADEIIVLDANSSDQTRSICLEYTDNVFNTDWPGFGRQKNRALDKATQEWILSIDADEVLSDALIVEIQNVLKFNPQGLMAYRIRRVSNYCGKFIRYGAWRNDKPLRLFKNNIARFDDRVIHESLQLLANTKVGLLKNSMRHYSYRNLSEVLQKLNHYSTDSARLRFDKGQRANMPIVLLKTTWNFLKGYILELGFMDGREGFLLAVSNAMGVFYRYTKLIYLQKQK